MTVFTITRQALFQRALVVLAGGLSLAAVPALAQAQQWQAGQRVQIGLNGQSGTIIEVLIPQMANGGALIKVHLDSMGPAFPTIGVSYDTVTARVTPSGGAAPAPAGNPPPAGANGGFTQAPPSGPAPVTPPPPDGNPPLPPLPQ